MGLHGRIFWTHLQVMQQRCPLTEVWQANEQEGQQALHYRNLDATALQCCRDVIIDCSALTLTDRADATGPRNTNI